MDAVTRLGLRCPYSRVPFQAVLQHVPGPVAPRDTYVVVFVVDLVRWSQRESSRVVDGASAAGTLNFRFQGGPKYIVSM